MLSLLSQADAIAEFTAPSNMSVKSQLEPLSKEELKSLINIIRKNEQKRLNEIVNKLIDKKKKNTLDLLTI
jgi:Cu2+-containing amine oxidase